MHVQTFQQYTIFSKFHLARVFLRIKLMLIDHEYYVKNLSGDNIAYHDLVEGANYIKQKQSFCTKKKIQNMTPSIF